MSKNDRILRKPRSWFVRFILVAPLLLLPAKGDAAVHWSISVIEGTYLPQLKTLDHVLKSNLTELGPRKLDARPTSYAVIYQGNSPIMPEMSPDAPKFGLQVQADINPRYSLILGNSVQTLDSSTQDIRPFFVGFFINAARETRFSLSLNQLWFGVRRYFELERPKPRFFIETGIIGITGADLTTDVWVHVFQPEEGFDFYKVVSTTSRGTGYANYIGVGGEYPLTQKLTLAMEGSYVVGGVSNIRWTRFFTTDPLEAGLIKKGDPVTFTDYANGRRGGLFLELDGWDLKGVLKFSF